MLKVPIIQGGMGVGISLGRLAGAVMKEGGMGVISAAHPGYRKENFWTHSLECNCQAILEETKKARQLSQGQGLLGINIMVASQDYKTYVETACQAKVDAIISGAGLPLSLPEYVTDPNILLAPIVSSAKAAQLIFKIWEKRYQRIPDFLVIEGSKAGGHLGFKKEELETQTCQELETILKEVLDVVRKYETKNQRKIPVFVGGGIYTNQDIKKFQAFGAYGVQIGTRFIATNECDADIRFKQAIIDAKEEDIVLVKSPTGFPGRAIQNSFVQSIQNKPSQKISRCVNCLIPCNPSNTPYCITNALIEAAKGNVDQGLVFTGTNGARIEKMMSVHELMKELSEGLL